MTGGFFSLTLFKYPVGVCTVYMYICMYTYFIFFCLLRGGGGEGGVEGQFK